MDYILSMVVSRMPETMPKSASLHDPGALDALFKRLPINASRRGEAEQNLLKSKLAASQSDSVEPFLKLSSTVVEQYQRQQFKDDFLRNYQAVNPKPEGQSNKAYQADKERAYKKACVKPELVEEFCLKHVINEHAKKNPPTDLSIDNKTHFIQAQKQYYAKIFDSYNTLHKIFERLKSHAGDNKSNVDLNDDLRNMVKFIDKTHAKSLHVGVQHDEQDEKTEKAVSLSCIAITGASTLLAASAIAFGVMPSDVASLVGQIDSKDELIDPMLESSELAAHSVEEITSGIVSLIKGEASLGFAKIGVGIARLSVDAIDLVTNFGPSLLAGGGCALGVVGSALNFAMAGLSQYEMMKTDKRINRFNKNLEILDELLSKPKAQQAKELEQLDIEIQLTEKSIAQINKIKTAILAQGELLPQLEKAEAELLKIEKEHHLNGGDIAHAKTTLEICQRENIPVPHEFQTLNAAIEKVNTLNKVKELPELEAKLSEMKEEKEIKLAHASATHGELQMERNVTSKLLMNEMAKKNDQRRSRNFWMGLGIATAAIAVVGVAGFASVATLGVLPAVTAAIFLGFAVSKYMQAGKYSQEQKFHDAQQNMQLYDKIFTDFDSFKEKTGVDLTQQYDIKANNFIGKGTQMDLRDYMHDLMAKNPKQAHDVLLALDKLAENPNSNDAKKDLKTAINNDKFTSQLFKGDGGGEAAQKVEEVEDDERESFHI